MYQRPEPLDIENIFDDDEIIVTKTDLKGRITYVNDVFCKVAEMTEEDAMGEPHSIIRHPDMPRSVFYLLWQTIEAKQEIFAYVKNLAKSGHYYWVFAHVSPTMDKAGNIIGYHSSRRAAPQAQIDAVAPIYKQVLEVENSYANRKEGMEAGFKAIVDLLEQNGVSYDEFVWSVANN
ncbi:PAS domain-containing protein [Pseudemcibacter aquimaris]|uniref:PAS domain-containing protein n=1 Tax=Pseudemcibacter aquimaris TaxID=2857064 RepID=UPI00201353A8|nr:PAS domain-containing protein [Pseudemcibacter aquimaris]MCC3861070.1 PAS domain-containing protein [Pseudemcibacter aquimaris]WDU59888.1 PAS domain-containing protein [Pseudemcibacter aquimaris]